MGPWSSDACSDPERVILFILMWHHSEILARPAGPLISCSARSCLMLCPATVRPESPPGLLRFQCEFEDHGAVPAAIEQGTLVFTFFMRGGSNVASVMSGECHVASMVTAECHMTLVVRWGIKVGI